MTTPVPTKTRTMKLALVAALLSLALVACSDGSDPRSTAANVPQVATPPASEPPEPAPEGRGTVRENADGTRTVTSTYGTAIVPDRPKRIVSVLGYIDFETMLALGVTPVGAGTQGGSLSSGFAPHLGQRTNSIQPLAWADGAPVEAIAALRPDLIFAPDEESAKLVAGIAPTVPAGAAKGREWKADFRYVAAVLGRTADADRLLTDYETDAKRLRERLAPLVTGRTVASPQVTSDRTQLFIDHKDAFSTAVLLEVGFTLAPMVTDATKVPIALSFERLPELQADVLFWQVRQRDEDGSRDMAAFQVAKSNPLWARIPAVASGKVFEVDNRPWYFPTILAAHQMLDDIEQALL